MIGSRVTYQVIYVPNTLDSTARDAGMPPVKTSLLGLMLALLGHPSSSSLRLSCSRCEAAGLKQYSADLRERLLRTINAGLSQAEAALVATALDVIDETSTNRAMMPRRARAPRGPWAVGTVPCNHGTNVTLLTALVSTRIAAPFVGRGRGGQRGLDGLCCAGVDPHAATRADRDPR